MNCLPLILLLPLRILSTYRAYSIKCFFASLHDLSGAQTLSLAAAAAETATSELSRENIAELLIACWQRWQYESNIHLQPADWENLH